MSRRIYLTVKDEPDPMKTIEPDFGSVAVLMFYANSINPEMAENMIYSLLSEYDYRMEKELPVEDYTYDNFSGHGSMEEINEIIQFINNRLLPSLKNESKDLDLVFDIFGDAERFMDIYYDVLHLGIIGIAENDLLEGYAGYIPNLFDKAVLLRDFYKRVIDMDKGYKVYTE
jgi:hypothetical protein